MTRNSDGHNLGSPPVSLLRGASLFLDFDGTLVDIAPTPDDVRVTSELRGLLSRLRERLGGRVAILTGRPADYVERVLDPVSLAIGGHHGLETRHGSMSTAVERPPILDEIATELRELGRKHPGVLIEDKPLGVAVHFRQAPEAEDACRAAVEQLAERSGLHVQRGKMLFELRPGGADKGDALRRLMHQAPFAGTAPVFLGDDLTDEPAFIAARELGGAGILIGRRADTAANYQLESVERVADWLRKACEAAG